MGKLLSAADAAAGCFALSFLFLPLSCPACCHTKEERIITMATITRTPFFLPSIFFVFILLANTKQLREVLSISVSNDRKYSCLFLFTPWKTINWNMKERVRVSYWMRLSLRVCIWMFLSRWVSVDLYMANFPPQRSQRSCQSFSYATNWSILPVSIGCNHLCLPQWCDWGQVRALWLTELKDFGGKCRVQWHTWSQDFQFPLLCHKHTVMGRLIKDMVHWWSMIFKIFQVFGTYVLFIELRDDFKACFRHFLGDFLGACKDFSSIQSVIKSLSRFGGNFRGL